MAIREQGPTRAIAQLAVGTTLDHVPAAGLENARLVILDTVGVMLAALEFPIGRIVVNYARDTGDGAGARVFGTDIRAPAPLAALANGTLAHGLDFDDHKHLSTHTLPAALSIGELLKSTGAQVLEAYVIGREVGAVLGEIIEAKRKLKQGPTFRGWYRVGVVGPIASAVSAGKLLGLTTDQMAIAIGIAASSSSGLRRNQGTMAKALHAGNAACDGINAALLASRGFSGDADILESPLGLVNAMCLPGEADWGKLDSFGKPFDIDGELGVKPFPACSPSHMPIAATLVLLSKHNVNPSEIEAIEADLHTFSLMRLDPNEAIATGYSLPYLLAVAVVDRAVSLDQVNEDRLHDPRVRDLMNKVRHDPDAAPPGRPERVTLRLKDGTVLRQEASEKPSLLDAVSVTAKYRDCASRCMASFDVEALREAVDRLEELPDIGAVLDLAATRAE